MVDQFGLEGMEERPHGSIVPTISLTKHGAGYPVSFKNVLVFPAAVLRASVGVVQKSYIRFSLPDGHEQGVDDQLAFQALVHGPTDYPAEVQIQHSRQIQPPFTIRNIGDVGQPGLVWPLSFKPTVEPIRNHRQGMFGISGQPEFTLLLLKHHRCLTG